ncbi:MAG: hypothetical protein M3304_08855, partial [Actinomycetota bacterium]|nr:hypothetical protein [Actinomycetota bacterium]
MLSGTAATPSPRLLLDRPLGRRLGLEALVGDRKAAFDGQAIRTGGQPLLGTLDRSQLVAKVVEAAGAKLVLVKIGGLVGEVLIAVRELAVFSSLAELGELALDARSLRREELPSTSNVHTSPL